MVNYLVITSDLPRVVIVVICESLSRTALSVCLWHIYSAKLIASQCNDYGSIWYASIHDDVIKWKPFPRNWPFVRGIHRSPVNSPHKGQWRGALTFPSMCTWIHGCANNREAGDLRRHHAHYDVTVMLFWKRLVRIVYIIKYGVGLVIHAGVNVRNRGPWSILHIHVVYVCSLHDCSNANEDILY